MSEIDEIIEAYIEKFDELRKVFLDDDTRLSLLKSAADSADFIPITETTGGWFVKFNKFREQLEFEFATSEAGFADQFAQLSHIGYGIPDFNNEIDVFAVEVRDKIPPNGTQPTWKCFGNRIENERYRVIDISFDPPIFDVP